MATDLHQTLRLTDRKRPASPPQPMLERIDGTVDRVAAPVVRFGERHGVTLLRTIVSLIMIGFGALKFFPGVSPAEQLAAKTVGILSFGLITDHAAAITTAVVEVAVGILLISGRLQRIAVCCLVGCLAGWMSPLVLFPTDLFTATGPSLTLQYLVKDMVLAGAALMIATVTFRSKR